MEHGLNWSNGLERIFFKG